eukprot:349862-Chlamydomonas_euryale.AAC.1
MRAMGSSNAPARNAGFSAPSYSNLDSISCTLHSDDASSGEPSRNVLARNTGRNSENGTRIVCQPEPPEPGATVSKLWQYAMLSHPGSVRRMSL